MQSFCGVLWIFPLTLGQMVPAGACNVKRVKLFSQIRNFWRRCPSVNCCNIKGYWSFFFFLDRSEVCFVGVEWSENTDFFYFPGLRIKMLLIITRLCKNARVELVLLYITQTPASIDSISFNFSSFKLFGTHRRTYGVK